MSNQMDDDAYVEPSADEWDVIVLESTPEQRYIFVPLDYWTTKRGKAVAALLKAQGRRRRKKPPDDWEPEG